MGIVGNEVADQLANEGTREPLGTGLASEPTISGIRSLCRDMRNKAQLSWWGTASQRLSRWYKKGEMDYEVRPLPELELRRPVLHRWLAIRSSHEDFSAYHTRLQHDDAKLVCSCGSNKTPEHLVLCRKSKRRFHRWPDRPLLPPSNRHEAVGYIRSLSPKSFAELLQVTEFYSKVCTR
jgi:hypothetical protein